MPRKIKKRSKKNNEEELEEQVEVVDAEGDSDEGELPDEVANFGDIVVDIPEYERDAFEEFSANAATWVESNRPQALGLMVLVLLIPFGIFAFVNYRDVQADAASFDAAQPLVAYQFPVEGEPILKVFEQDDKIKKPKTIYPDSDAKWNAVYKAADDADKAHGGDSLGTSVKFSKAAAAYHLGKFEEAVTLYEKVLADKDSEPLHVFATLGLAMSQAGKGDTDNAVATFDSLGKMGDEYAPFALYHKGRVLETAGKKAEAKDAYHKLLELDANTTYKTDVERRIATL